MKVKFAEHLVARVKQDALVHVNVMVRDARRLILKDIAPMKRRRFFRRLKHTRGRMFIEAGIAIPKEINLRNRIQRRDFIRTLTLETRVKLQQTIAQTIKDAAETEGLTAVADLETVRLRQLGGVLKCESHEDLLTLSQMTRDTVLHVVNEFRGVNAIPDTGLPISATDISSP